MLRVQPTILGSTDATLARQAGAGALTRVLAPPPHADAHATDEELAVLSDEVVRWTQKAFCPPTISPQT